MAGDWIKMRGNLWDDPRVAKIVDITDSTEAAVVGALYWLWSTADQHTTDGVMLGLTMRAIDRKTGVTGFAEALCAIGWIADHPEGIRIVDFETHNGASAKKRCQTAKRVANHAATNAPLTQEEEETNAPSVSTALAREEKRREEKKEEKREGESAAKAPRPLKKCPADFLITQEMQSWAAENAGAVDLKIETDKFMDYTFSSTRSDWFGTWRNWMRKAQEYADKHKPDKPYETPYAKSMREKYEKITPMIAAQNPNAPKKLNPNDFINGLGDFKNDAPKLRIAG